MIDIAEFAGQVVTVMLGSGAAFAFLNWRTERRRRIDDVEFLATTLAVQFEGYAIDCADKVSDHQLATDSDGCAGKLIGKIPDFNLVTQHEGYRLLDRAVLDEILQFPQERLLAERAAIFWWDVVGDPDCCNNAYRDNTVKVAHHALMLATKLRSRYKLPKRSMAYGEWDIREFLAKEVQKLSDETKA